jgi:beta-1,4-glucosyltransferase
MSTQSHTYIAGFPLLDIAKDSLSELIHSRIESSQKVVLFFANTNFIVQCKPILKRMLNNDVLLANDGVGIDIVSVLLYRQKFKSNLNGTDFTPYLLKASSRRLRVFLLGGKPEVLNKAAYHLVHDLGQIVVGSCDGYDGLNRLNLINEINAVEPDVILVAMGNPRQELWILDHYHELSAQFISGVGALFDFWAGDKVRAPEFIQKMRMEWCYRMFLEPKRLVKRYSVDILKFLAISIFYKNLRIKQ